jgi:hypothetical protein
MILPSEHLFRVVSPSCGFVEAEVIDSLSREFV